MVVLSKFVQRGSRSAFARVGASASQMQFAAAAAQRRSFASTELSTAPVFTDLKDQIFALAKEKADLVNEIKKSEKVVDQVTASQVFGGMRGMPGMVTETSDLDANLGIKYRGYSLVEANELLPKAPGGEAGEYLVCLLMFEGVDIGALSGSVYCIRNILP